MTSNNGCLKILEVFYKSVAKHEWRKKVDFTINFDNRITDWRSKFGVENYAVEK